MDKTFENLKNILVGKLKSFDKSWKWFDNLSQITTTKKDKKIYKNKAFEEFVKRFNLILILENFYTKEEIENFMK